MMTTESIPYHGSRLDASIELGQKIADQWGINTLMIQMARDITGQWRAKDRFEEARAIQEWINRRVRYVPDPHGAEMLSDPLTTIKHGGDCDDQAILAAALLQAVGHDARVAAVTWKGRTDASHAVVADLTAGCIVDPISVSPDLWPPAPYEVQAITFRNKEGQMQTMNGLFSKVFKAIAKPFQKIFPAKTLLGKIADPFGLTDPKRNLNLAGRVADVVGTAAALAVGGYAIGAAAGGSAGGFWATSAAGGKLVAATAWKGLAAMGGAAGTAAETVLPALLMTAAGGGGVAQAQPQDSGMTQAQMDAWGQYGTPQDASAGTTYSGGGGGGGAFTLPDGTPGATVPVTDTMPGSSATPILLAAAAVGVLVIMNRKKKRGR
jgi:predicted transglutaminase-like cysteine proteinase